MLKILGKAPSSSESSRLNSSPNNRGGKFYNLHPTQLVIPGITTARMLIDFLNKPQDSKPSRPVPVKQPNLLLPAGDAPVINWFGHSSYFIRSQGISFLVDPVFSGYASPFSGIGKAFPGSDSVSPKDFPQIDVMILTHDHYDHLDYRTIKKFIGKTTHFYGPLGIGSHLKYWGIEGSKITEFDWWDSFESSDFSLHATPSRHFSGRTIVRNQTLWTSFVLKLGVFSIFIGSDSGYDSSFSEIGNRFGPFDMAFLECGQYDEKWPNIHMTPEECVQAAIDLKAEILFPVHWSKFALAFHAWDEPVKRVSAESARRNQKICTPLIGEDVVLGKAIPNRHWWKDV